MRHQRLPRLALVIGTMSLPVLLLGGTAFGQTVQMFDSAPTLEQLRNIIIPESHGGMTRRIVLPQDTAPQVTTPIQPVSASVPVMVTDPVSGRQNRERGGQTGAVLEQQPAPASAKAPSDAPSGRTARGGVVGFRINFAFNSNAIPAAYAVFIDRVGELMREEPQLKLRIEGHTDAVGSDRYNLALSQRRAIAVARYLVGQHIEPERLSPVGKGKAEPLTSNPYDSRNRRVQFVRVE